MATSNLTLEQIYDYFKENGNVVKNRELVHHFKEYLTDPATKDDARIKFKKYVNTLAQTKSEGDDKFLTLKTKYHNYLESPKPTLSQPAFPPSDPRNSLGIPVSPDCSPSKSPAHRQPPPYRPPPPVTPTNSLDNVSLSSIMSAQDVTPQAPPRRKAADRQKSMDEESTPTRQINNGGDVNNCDEKQTVSVKERMEKFNRMASMEDELSPRQPKSAERSKVNKGAEEDDGASVTSLEPKKCMEWYVTASKGDIQELLKLAQDEPRLVNRKQAPLHQKVVLSVPDPRLDKRFEKQTICPIALRYFQSRRINRLSYLRPLIPSPRVGPKTMVPRYPPLPVECGASISANFQNPQQRSDGGGIVFIKRGFSGDAERCARTSNTANVPTAIFRRILKIVEDEVGHSLTPIDTSLFPHKLTIVGRISLVLESPLIPYRGQDRLINKTSFDLYAISCKRYTAVSADGVLTYPEIAGDDDNCRIFCGGVPGGRRAPTLRCRIN
ncbi:hypothetical protein MTP99_013844 [Tenebrio molitor]|nr:hypothetical protein MTP99_013844 [Tenebrio molitor]